MAFSISEALRNVIANAIGNSGAGVNFDAGVLEIRSGAPPGPGAADAGVLLSSITLPADAFAAAAVGALAKAGTWEDTAADAAGVAGHFRVKQTGDTGGASGATDERMEGTITGTGGGGDMELDNVNIALGQQIMINSFTVTMPAS